MAGMGPGFDDPEHDDLDPAGSARDSPFRRWLVGELDGPETEFDDYDPVWRTQDTPFRRWLVDGLAAAGSGLPAEAVSCFAPANRYHGLSRENTELLAILIDTTVDAVRAAHKADLEDWAREQELRDHPDLAVLDADLDRIRPRS
ncbi:hypothetical protein ACIBSV_49700 [Embleya sp. NPDC050154]|uniref:hypothetical protein n=1 Tax=Embleya sp. NPDC050154 TaxID=3363988 RepID=UPI0037BB8750